MIRNDSKITGLSNWKVELELPFIETGRLQVGQVRAGRGGSPLDTISLRCLMR